MHAAGFKTHSVLMSLPEIFASSSLAAVEELSRKHEGFVTTLDKQAKIVDELETR